MIARLFFCNIFILTGFFASLALLALLNLPEWLLIIAIILDLGAMIAILHFACRRAIRYANER